MGLDTSVSTVGPSPRPLAAAGFADDVRRGLGASPKTLEPKYFYDELGSHLFAAICALPEYYLTRAETAILSMHAGEMVVGPAPPVRLIELGSGDAVKTRYLIEALLTRQPELEYVPIDVSVSALAASSRRLRGAYPALRVQPRVGDYRRELEALAGELDADAAARALVLFLGSTLGNLHPPDAADLLRGVRAVLRPGGALLLGVDLKKGEEVLLPAYDDPLGVTAAFNLNLLVRINRELGGEFDVRRFRHRALYNAELGRMEILIESREEQTVAIRDLGLEIAFAAGEAILSECSYKYDRDQVAALAVDAGFTVAGSWTDPDGYFLSTLLTAR
jgi:L-histidine Nalpha-methyltransferase